MMHRVTNLLARLVGGVYGCGGTPQKEMADKERKSPYQEYEARCAPKIKNLENLSQCGLMTGMADIDHKSNVSLTVYPGDEYVLVNSPNRLVSYNEQGLCFFVCQWRIPQFGQTCKVYLVTQGDLPFVISGGHIPYHEETQSDRCRIYYVMP